MPYEHVRPVDVVAMSPTAAAASTGLRPERIQAAVRAGEIRAVRIGCKNPHRSGVPVGSCTSQ
jgi:hypothetical protein